MLGRLLATLALAAPPLLAPAPAQAAWFCTYDAGVVTARLPEGHVVRLMVYPDRTIHFVDNSDNQLNARCGRATTRNTDRVRVIGRGSGARLIYVQRYGAFAPGRTPEPGPDEIEFVLRNVISVWFQGKETADDVVVGTRGINVNHDGDADIRYDSAMDDLSLFLFGGDDRMSAAGGWRTGDPWPRRNFLSADGFDGRDVLLGRTGRDLLRGGPGDDLLRGRGGADELHGDGHRNRLYRGDGPDWLTTGSGWAEWFYGGRGDDLIEARDFDADLAVDGGPGTDSARVDAEDPAVGIERLLP